MEQRIGIGMHRLNAGRVTTCVSRNFRTRNIELVDAEKCYGPNPLRGSKPRRPGSPISEGVCLTTKTQIACSTLNLPSVRAATSVSLRFRQIQFSRILSKENALRFASYQRSPTSLQMKTPINFLWLSSRLLCTAKNSKRSMMILMARKRGARTSAAARVPAVEIEGHTDVR